MKARKSMLRLWKSAVSLEDLFLERYDQLLGWGLQISQGDRALAEDLVHDAYIQFTLTHPDLNSIENLDGYLYGILRVLHRSGLRKAARRQLRQLSIVEFDSALLGLRTVEAGELIQAQDELRRVCQFCCARKENARSASVLILRFFHGYYPSEIAQILRCSRQAVDIRLGIARTEAKSVLQGSGRFQIIGVNVNPARAQVRYAQDAGDFLSGLRDLIFQSRRGECLTRDDSKSLYGSTTTSSSLTPVGTRLLAHVVSCPRCLDEITGLLKLPPLATRYAVDSLGTQPRERGRRGGGGDVSGGGSAPTGDGPTIRRSQQRAEETFEHLPKELCIAVNGQIYGSQKIIAERSDQMLVAENVDKIDFVEVFSEQDVRLLLLPVAESPPLGAFEQTAHVELSDRRTLHVALRFTSPWPTLHIFYDDPTFANLESVRREVVDQDGAVGAEIQQRVTDPIEDAPVKAAPDETGLRQSVARLVGLVGPAVLLRPVTVTFVFAILLVGALVFFGPWRHPAPTLSAADLLQKSAASEAAQLAKTDQVVHRSLSFEEKRVDGILIAKRRIEVWQSATQGITARRLYGEQNQLIAGDWRRRDGVETIYHHGARPKIQLGPENRGKVSLNFDDVWQLSPSAAEFRLVIGNSDKVRVEERASTYAISYENEALRNGEGLVRATIGLSKNDLHAIEQTFVIRQAGEVREFRVAETAFERRVPDAVPPATFEPEPELLTTDTGIRTSGDAAKTSTSSKLPISLPPAAATADLEVEILRLLHEAKADLGEQISTTRGVDGLLRVTGLVDSNARREEIMRMLQPVAKNAACRIQIQTIDEAVAQQQRQGSESGTTHAPVIEQKVETGNETIAAAPELRRHFTSHEQMREFSARMVRESASAMDHIYAMKRLVTKFSLRELNELSPDAKNKWLALIRGHARAYQNDLASLHKELQSIFGASSAGAGESGPELTDDASLVRAVGELFSLAATNDGVIRSDFVTSSGNSASAISSRKFWQSMRSAENLAARISRQ